MKVTFKGKTTELIGDPANVNDQFDDFYVINKENKRVDSKDLHGKPTLISVVPDIDTSVCSIQTKKFNQKMDEYPGVNFLTISTNTVAEQQNWCAAENVKNMQLVSDTEGSFGKTSKLLIPTMGILARSVWVLDKNGKIVYRQIVDEITDEPDYEKALDQLKELN
ncbi:thiol peroxidase [Lactobacillus hamsteri]|uniref:Thiol peroxidase n=1 Tax=Lactobacillus hamsteri DSM 5661 = JCM 6256 TaxID=1423754 RepID=A0A0R1YC11_9LACO|nr:thiol peroxidase [Lactobacillus hamsteri]KRM38484.1 thiol peroxidase [Lactobacillus hamsteri DSM 5661 = JCM 6256]